MSLCIGRDGTNAEIYAFASIISVVLIKVFPLQSMDTDNSGTITADELREAMKKQGSPLVQEELQRLLESIDVDATGRWVLIPHRSAELSDHTSPWHFDDTLGRTNSKVSKVVYSNQAAHYK